MSVTIHDVARAANVSPSTVSRAYTMPELLRGDTRERVLAAARMLGYQPNRAARGLITGRTGNIGLIVPDLANPFFPAVLKGAQARAREADLAVFLADAEEDPGLEEELIRAMSKQVDGVLLCSSRATEATLAAIAQETPLVLLNRRIEGVPAVVMDNAGGARQAVEHLAALGHQRLAYANGPSSSWSNRARRRAVKARAGSLGLDVVELGPFAPTFEGGLAAADPCVAARVTAVLAYNDLVALGMQSRLRDRAIEVPRQISIVGFDDIPMAQMGSPALTTVAMPCERAGRLAIDVLTRRIRNEANGASGLLASTLIVRASTAPPAPDQLP
ncbi:MAG TPA: LacI family DNA-binding transcriptional regulator [Jatrophihabitans sp.]|nr:LacI family DNA-binding transcriptional regulator [Jatrophihabitans sp.]